MNKIEYEIKLDVDGRPYIYMGENHELTPENNFFGIELAKFLIDHTIIENGNSLDDETYNNMVSCLNVLEDISNEVAILIKEKMLLSGDISQMFATNYNILVKSIKERNALPLDDIVYNDKIYSRKIGLRVLVIDKNKIYELVDGIDNKNWKEIK